MHRDKGVNPRAKHAPTPLACGHTQDGMTNDETWEYSLAS